MVFRVYINKYINLILITMRVVSLAILALVLFSCSHSSVYIITSNGYTQGTTYQVKYITTDSINYGAQFDSLLEKFDQSLSTYDNSSLISRINNNQAYTLTDTLFNAVYTKAQEVYQKTNGAFDITVGPLVKAYGFAKEGVRMADSVTIDSLLHFVGMDKVRLVNGRVIKTHPSVQLDVNAIAQGYAADIIGQYLSAKNINNYLVEVGGEVLARGDKNGKPWRIGVDKPIEGNMVAGAALQAVISLSDGALATSGNYRRFYVKNNGAKIVHTINPKTGYPQQHNLLSVTVIAPNCITADAYATACMVLGLEKAKQLINSTSGLEAYFIYSNNNGDFKTTFTPGLKKFIDEQ